MGVRASHECRVQHAREMQIVDEAAASLQQRAILDALIGLPIEVNCFMAGSE